MMEKSLTNVGLFFYTSLSSIKYFICLRSERMIVDFENLESVAPNEEQISIIAINRCIIVYIIYTKICQIIVFY
jgi:hypothetical protein